MKRPKGSAEGHILERATWMCVGRLTVGKVYNWWGTQWAKEKKAIGGRVGFLLRIQWREVNGKDGRTAVSFTTGNKRTSWWLADYKAWHRREMRDRDSCTMPGKLLPPSKRLSQVTEKRERQSHTLQMVKVYLQSHRPVLNVCKCKMRSDKYAFLIKGMYLSLTVINGPICGGDNGIFQHYVFVEAVKLKDCQPAACMRRLSLYISVYVEYV